MHKISVKYPVPDRLNLDTGWSIGETAFERIANFASSDFASRKILSSLGVVRVLFAWRWRFLKRTFCLWKATGEIMAETYEFDANILG